MFLFIIMTILIFTYKLNATFLAAGINAIFVVILLTFTITALVHGINLIKIFKSFEKMEGRDRLANRLTQLVVSSSAALTTTLVLVTIGATITSAYHTNYAVCHTCMFIYRLLELAMLGVLCIPLRAISSGGGSSSRQGGSTDERTARRLRDSKYTFAEISVTKVET